jgi:REP element-mobilizing transposase RayT
LVQFVTFRLIDSLPASRRGEWEHLLKIEDVTEKRTKLEEYLDRCHGACQLRDPRIARLVEETLLHFHDERYEMLAWCVMPNHVHVLVHVWQTPLSKLERSWKQFVQTQANLAAEERRPPAGRDRTERRPPARLDQAERRPPAGLDQAERRPPARRDRTERRSPARHESVIAPPAPCRRPAFRWQREYWDTYMRDEQQERTAVRYIENNPIKARLCAAADQWPFSSARFRHEYGRLILPSHHDAARRAGTDSGAEM